MQKSYQKELLDATDIPFEAIQQNMVELNFINTWLGGHAISIEGFKQLIKQKKEITICEIGCGGGDNLIAINKWCKKNNITLHCIGIDINENCIAFAKSNTTLQKAHWINLDYAMVEFDKNPDIIFSSLFCHHFNNDSLVKQLSWMKENATIGFFINDLHRHKLAYWLIKWLTQFFSKSYLVKHDAPLSVARGFVKNEWKETIHQAKITQYSIHWKWAFRHLIIVQND
jgi:2-polyprenyl-3-methyl-5-hydroxy-6-metoxy-1,4-benzoquinol methylase